MYLWMYNKSTYMNVHAHAHAHILTAVAGGQSLSPHRLITSTLNYKENDSRIWVSYESITEQNKKHMFHCMHTIAL